MAEALEDEHQILRAFTAQLYAMGWFPSRSIREAQNAEVKALQKDVQVQAEARFALMELMDACAPWPGLVQVLHSKGLPAFHRIESMFALREMLNEQLSLCDKGLFHEVVTKGNISKLGAQKKMYVKFLATHGMLRRMWEVIDTDWLEKEGEILFDLKRWGESVLRLDYWKRQASDGCIGFCGIGSMVLDTHRTKLLVHAIDFGYSKAIAVNRVRLHRDVTVECCRVLGKDVVSKHIGRCFQLACDLLKALEDADSSANSGVQIPVWFCQHDAQKQHTSLDARYAVASTKAREGKVTDNLGP